MYIPINKLHGQEVTTNRMYSQFLKKSKIPLTREMKTSEGLMSFDY